MAQSLQSEIVHPGAVSVSLGFSLRSTVMRQEVFLSHHFHLLGLPDFASKNPGLSVKLAFQRNRTFFFFFQCSNISKYIWGMIILEKYFVYLEFKFN